jgi:tetratricopeptide (TPR) repeat protein
MRPALIGLLVCSLIAFVIQSQEAPRKNERPSVQLKAKRHRTNGRDLAHTQPPPIVYDKLQTPFSSEQHWIADQILRDIGEILLFAKDPTIPISTQLKLETRNDPVASPAFHVSADAPAGHAAIAFELKHHLWAPENYSAWVISLIENWGVSGSSSSHPVDSSLTSTLLDADFANLIRQSKRISEELNRHPLDSDLNDAAAFILSCFALREASGMFSDIRPTLSRISAHLAIARAVQPEEKDTGKLARIIQLALISRQAETLEAIKTLPAKQSQWANVLMLRATGDWRLLKTPATMTSLEQIECFRALRRDGLPQKATAFLKEINAFPSPDWSRIAMESPMSVQEGHLYAERSLLMEVAALAVNWETFSASSLQKTETVTVLNRPATRCVIENAEGQRQLEVLSWGDVAAFHQRHICHSIVTFDHVMREMWGVPDTARQFERTINEIFSKLTLYPIVKKQMTEPAKVLASEMLDTFALWRNHPELLTPSSQASMFMGMRIDVPGQLLAAPVTDWFRPEIPFGTAFQLEQRGEVGPFHLAQKSKSLWSELATIAPYELVAQTNFVRTQFGDSYSVDKFVEATNIFSEFNLNAMWEIAQRAKDQSALYEKVMWRLCALEPEYFITLGNYFLDRDMFPQAARAFQSAYDQATDRVYMANSSRWLVSYYLETGRNEEATKIATDAADAYSAGGLITMAFLLERTGKIKEAEEYLKKLRDRYPSHEEELKEFYIRNRQHDPDYEKIAATEMAKLFPAGFERVTIANFTSAPLDGIMIKTETPRVKTAHFKLGDIIVAIDGMRVHTQKQYCCLRDLSFDPNMTLIVWENGQYAERKVSLPQRRLNCDLTDFASRGASRQSRFPVANSASIKVAREP